MTLTNFLPAEQAGPVKQALETAHAAAVPADPVRIDRFALFRQDDRAGRFRLLFLFVRVSILCRTDPSFSGEA